MKQIAFEFHNYDTGHCYVDYVERNGLGKNQGYTKIPLYSIEKQSEPTERKTAAFSRIREFIRKQRSIGEHLFAKRLRGNYGKRADEFYDQFADSVYYRDKDGNEIGLDIKTLWWFRWNEFASQSLPEISDTEIEKLADERCQVEDEDNPMQKRIDTYAWNYYTMGFLEAIKTIKKRIK